MNAEDVAAEFVRPLGPSASRALLVELIAAAWRHRDDSLFDDAGFSPELPAALCALVPPPPAATLDTPRAKALILEHLEPHADGDDVRFVDGRWRVSCRGEIRFVSSVSPRAMALGPVVAAGEAERGRDAPGEILAAIREHMGLAPTFGVSSRREAAGGANDSSVPADTPVPAAEEVARQRAMRNQILARVRGQLGLEPGGPKPPSRREVL